MTQFEQAHPSKDIASSSDDAKRPTIADLKIFTLENQSGARVNILNFGGRINGLWLPVNGELINVVLGPQKLEGYLTDTYFMGGITGRFSNRIKDSHVAINGHDYQLTSNEGDNQLHGGQVGFHARIWEFLPQSSPNCISLKYQSRDGEEGYPGNLEVIATYSWTDDFILTLEILATTDKETVINLSNHAYFNLAGDHGSIIDHELMINSDHYTPTDAVQIPTGEIKPLQGTAFDFSQSSNIGRKILEGKADNCIADGFDHNYVLRNNYGDETTHAATLLSPASGVSMRLYTNTPGLQLYTGHHLRTPYTPYAGLCLEPQNFPDAPNHENFPSAALKPGETYHSITRYSLDLPKTEQT